jgi:hypothetical protein
MAIHGFVLEEDTKPAHEHHLQTTPTLRQALFSYIMTVSRPLSLTAANTLVKAKSLSRYLQFASYHLPGHV